MGAHEGSATNGPANAREVLQREAWLAFERLLGIDDAHARGRALGTLACSDPALHARVRALLEADRRAASAGEDFLARGAAVDHLPVADVVAQVLGATLVPGTGIGPYALSHRLGDGGMGEVWLARRVVAQADGARTSHDATLPDAKVALKLLHPHLVHSSFERFVREGRILAALRHPNIARLLDTGLEPDGRPWLALEAIDGERIDLACERRGLDVPQRLRLVLQVCDAVAHAHARGVLHRDIKPANILVDAAGQAKLLDFGIAKLMADGPAGLAGAGGVTRMGARLFTPDYAAPEQVAGQAVTAATDVHALGTLLYLLLCGRRPYGAAQGTSARIEHEMSVTAPPRLGCLVPALRGNLDAIVMRALRKAPHQRYASVDALADDIRRHLDGRAVRARRAAALAASLDLLRWRRAPMRAALAVAAALACGLVATTCETRRAETQRMRAEGLRDFAHAILVAHDPTRAGAPAVHTPQHVVRTAVARLDTAFAGDAALHAEFLGELGVLAANLGDHEGGTALLQRALAEERALHGERSTEVARGLQRIARTTRSPEGQAESRERGAQAPSGTR